MRMGLGRSIARWDTGTHSFRMSDRPEFGIAQFSHDACQKKDTFPKRAPHACQVASPVEEVMARRQRVDAHGAQVEVPDDAPRGVFRTIAEEDRTLDWIRRDCMGLGLGIQALQMRIANSKASRSTSRGNVDRYIPNPCTRVRERLNVGEIPSARTLFARCRVSCCAITPALDSRRLVLSNHCPLLNVCQCASRRRVSARTDSGSEATMRQAAGGGHRHEWRGGPEALFWCQSLGHFINGNLRDDAMVLLRGQDLGPLVRRTSRSRSR